MRNRAVCHLCKDIIEGNKEGIVRCKCGALGLDGSHHTLFRSWNDFNFFNEDGYEYDHPDLIFFRQNEEWINKCKDYEHFVNVLTNFLMINNFPLPTKDSVLNLLNSIDPKKVFPDEK